MPRRIAIAEKMQAISMIKQGELSQREIAKVTGLSRPYLRKIAKQIGHQFPRNGYEIKGRLCMCGNCGMFMRKPPSKIERADNHFCSVTCKNMYSRGENHANWKGGTSSHTFSEWLKNQGEYKQWRNAILIRDDYVCQITGKKLKDGDLDVHHIMPKAEYQHLALDVDNGLTISKEAHRLIHHLIRQGKGFEEAIEEARLQLEAEDIKD